MLICVTNSKTKQVMAIKTDFIFVVERSIKNALETILISTMNGPNGLMAYSILESPEECMAMVASAERHEETLSIDRQPASPIAQ